LLAPFRTCWSFVFRFVKLGLSSTKPFNALAHLHGKISFQMYRGIAGGLAPLTFAALRPWMRVI
jgi:hypothetical protein